MATTLSSNLYPPLIDTFMPAFSNIEEPTIYFSISPYNSASEIKKLHVSLVFQDTNLNALKQNINHTTAPTILDGIYIINFNSVTPKNGLYSFTIPKGCLRNGTSFSTERFYKLQIRFDASEESDISGGYLTTQRNFFSEWSSVCLLKAIHKPTLVLDRFTNKEGKNNKEEDLYFNPGVIQVSGKLINSNEKLKSYSIKIYEKGNKENIVDQVENFTVGVLDGDPQINWFADANEVDSDKQYTLDVSYTTRNQFSDSKQVDFNIYKINTDYFNSVQWNFVRTPLDDYSIVTNNNKIITEEDGIVRFTIDQTSLQGLPAGYLYIKRASNLDNFKKWELLSCTRHKNENTISTTPFEDPTVSSLIEYRYSAQYQTKKGSFSATHRTNYQDIIYPDFYDILFYRDGKQLAIRYDANITSLKPVVNRQKIDTLGSKYPKFAENAMMNYKQFSITGLIDAESDFNRQFLSEISKEYEDKIKRYDEEMGGKYQVRNDTISYKNIKEVTKARSNELYKKEHPYDVNDPDSLPQKIQAKTEHDVYPWENWWWEREFRERAIEWLNDGEPKLFRSMTEGNMVVMLTDIALTPNRTIGRRLYSFSATMYEIEDGHSLEVLDSLGIYHVQNDARDNPFKSDDVSSTKTIVGQTYERTFGENPANIFLDESAETWKENEPYNTSLNDQYENIIYEKEDYNGSYNGLVWEFQKESCRLKDLRIRFKSAPYECFNDEKFIGYGYQIWLKTEIEDNKENQENKEIPIFVNSKGYYQIPSAFKVQSLRFTSGTQATLDYILEYKYDYNEDLVPESTKVERKIVGQEHGMWIPGTQISPILKDKYKWLQYGDKGKINTNQYLDNWHALNLELTPYTVGKIQFINIANNSLDDATDFVVGRTSILNLVDNYPINELIIEGKRMIRTDPSRQDYLDEWEFVLDPSADWNKNEDYYSIKWNEQTPVVLFPKNENGTEYYSTKYDSNSNFQSMDIDIYWNNYTNKQHPYLVGYESINAIEDPKFNTVYGFKDENDTIKYMIYYLDYCWFEVDFIDTDNQSIILAKVPVYGTINYWAEVIEQVF